MQPSNVQNILNSQANQLEQYSLENNKTYELAIVGSGISCAYTLIHYITCLKAKLTTIPSEVSKAIKVAVIDKSGEFWTGIPYGSRTGKQSLIITALKEFLPQPERDRFINWLTDNYSNVFQTLQERPGVLTKQWLQSYEQAMLQGDWDELFIPRYVFGWYITERVESLLQEAEEQGYLKCDLFNAEVFNIHKLQDTYQVEFTTSEAIETSLLAQKVILAIGSPPNKADFFEQFEATDSENSADNNVFFTPNMYEPSQDRNIEEIFEFLKQSQIQNSEPSQVLILGSNASALETLYSFNNIPEANNLISKFIVISPNGEFPHLIDDNSVSTTYIPQNLISLAESSEFTAQQILEAVKQDVQAALEQNETVNRTYAVISKAVIKALNLLSFEEQKLFVIKYGVEIGKFQRRAGKDYLNVVDKLIFQGRLEFLKGKFVKTIPLPTGRIGFEFITSDGNQREIFAEPIQVIINCAGFQNLTQSTSPLIQNLIQQDICTPNDSLCGFEMNENFAANENFYLMGPLVAGNINDKLKVWHAESCGRIINLSQQLAEVLM
ncbi:MAG: FAD/NAD(P)-binding protein [Waterburya sp.]